MKNKFLIALMLVLVIVLCSFASAMDIFSDLPKDHWSYNYVYSMVNAGIIKGYEDGTFRPGGNITRAEFAKILAESFKLNTSAPATYEFEDVSPEDWFYPYINAASKYLTAYKNGDKLTFAPNAQAVREDMTVAMVKAMGKQDASVDESILESFSDASRISPNLKKYVAIAYANGYISGYEDETFKPLGNLTRAETATLVAKTLVREGKIVIDDWTVINPDPGSMIEEPAEVSALTMSVSYTIEATSGASATAIAHIDTSSYIPESIKVSKRGNAVLDLGYQEDADALAITYHEYYDKQIDFVLEGKHAHFDTAQILEYHRVAMEQFPVAKTGADPECKLTIKGANGKVLLEVAVELILPANPVESIYITGLDYTYTVENEDGSISMMSGASMAAMGAAYYNGSAEIGKNTTVKMGLSRDLKSEEKLIITVDGINYVMAINDSSSKKVSINGGAFYEVAQSNCVNPLLLVVTVTNGSDDRKLGTIKLKFNDLVLPDVSDLAIVTNIESPLKVFLNSVVSFQLNRALNAGEELVVFTNGEEYGTVATNIRGSLVSINGSDLKDAYMNWCIHLIHPMVVGYKDPDPLMKVVAVAGAQRKELASIDLVFVSANEIKFSLENSSVSNNSQLRFTTSRSLEDGEAVEADVVVYNQSGAEKSTSLQVSSSKGNIYTINGNSIYNFIYSDEVQSFIGGQEPQVALRVRVVTTDFVKDGVKYSSLTVNRVVAEAEFALVLESLDELSMVSHTGSLDSNYIITLSRALSSTEEIRVLYGYYPMTGFTEVSNVTVSGKTVTVPGSAIQAIWFVQDPTMYYPAVMANHTVKVQVIENGTARDLGSFLVGNSSYGLEKY